MNGSLPAGQAGLTTGMIVDSYNDKKIKSYEDFVYNFQYCVKPEDKISFGSGNQSYVITTTANPEDKTKPLIGIKNIKNEVKMKDNYEWLAPFIFKIKSLLKWLFILNLLIGLANLLPLGIVDGGRMLQVALHKVVDNKEKAQKIWVFIAVLFLVFLVFGLLINYLGNPFAMLG